MGYCALLPEDPPTQDQPESHCRQMISLSHSGKPIKKKSLVIHNLIFTINLIQKTGQTEANKTATGNGRAARHLGTFSHLCGLDNTHALPAFRHDYGGLNLLQSLMGSGSNIMLMFRQMFISNRGTAPGLRLPDAYTRVPPQPPGGTEHLLATSATISGSRQCLLTPPL